MKEKQGYGLIIFLGLLSAIAPLSTDMYLPALPEFQGEFGISASITQLTLTAVMLGMAVGQIFGGPISDKMGRKPPLLLGMAVFTIASACCFLTDDIYHFLFFRLLQGFSGSFGLVISRAIARDKCEGPDLMRYMSILMMVNGLAPILAPVVGGQILNITNWRGIFAVLILIGIAMVVQTVCYRETLPKERRSATVSRSFHSFPLLLKDSYFFGHCLVQCFVFGAFFSYIAGSSFLFQNVYEVSPQTYSYIFGSIGVGLLLMGGLPAKMAGTVPGVVMMRYAILVPFIGSILLLAGFLFGAPIWYTFPVLFVTIIPLSVLGASSTALAMTKAGRMSGSASALLGCSGMLLGGVCMPLTGIAGDHTAVPMGVLMTAGYGLALLAFYRLVAPAHKKEL